MQKLSEADFEIRQLSEGDVDAYRALRLEALQKASDAFGASFEDESRHSDDFFWDRLKNSPVMGAFADDSALVATVGFYRNASKKREHVGRIWGVYTKPDYRGLGLSKGLLEHIILHSTKDVELLQLGVSAQNEAALGMYKNAGFEEYGVEKKARKIDGQYYDEILMVKFLR